MRRRIRRATLGSRSADGNSWRSLSREFASPPYRDSSPPDSGLGFGECVFQKVGNFLEPEGGVDVLMVLDLFPGEGFHGPDLLVFMAQPQLYAVHAGGRELPAGTGSVLAAGLDEHED